MNWNKFKHVHKNTINNIKRKKNICMAEQRVDYKDIKNSVIVL